MSYLQPVEEESDATHREQGMHVDPTIASLIGLLAQHARLLVREWQLAGVRHGHEELGELAAGQPAVSVGREAIVGLHEGCEVAGTWRRHGRIPRRPHAAEMAHAAPAHPTTTTAAHAAAAAGRVHTRKVRGEASHSAGRAATGRNLPRSRPACAGETARRAGRLHGIPSRRRRVRHRRARRAPGRAGDCASGAGRGPCGGAGRGDRELFAHAHHREVGEIDAAVAVEVDRGVPAQRAHIALARGGRVACRARPTLTGWVSNQVTEEGVAWGAHRVELRPPVGHRPARVVPGHGGDEVLVRDEAVAVHVELREVGAGQIDLGRREHLRQKHTARIRTRFAPKWRRAGSSGARGCPGRQLGAASLGLQSASWAALAGRIGLVIGIGAHPVGAHEAAVGVHRAARRLRHAVRSAAWRLRRCRSARRREVRQAECSHCCAVAKALLATAAKSCCKCSREGSKLRQRRWV
eukprot:scaffold7436_cov59-Phaeocystis_antarctica.AAC.1